MWNDITLNIQVEEEEENQPLEQLAQELEEPPREDQKQEATIFVQLLWLKQKL
jgi:hypothetical protein